MHTTTFNAAMSALILATIFVGCESSEDSSATWQTDVASQHNNTSATQQTTTEQQATQTTQTTEEQTTQNTTKDTKTSSSDTTKTTSDSNNSEDSTTTTTTTEVGAADAISFGALSWSYGGFRGGSATKTTASIGGLRTTKDGLSYSWTGPTLSSWGLSDGDYSAVACFFVNNGSSWVGGKFDFISTSRRSRSFENIYDGYHGWSLSGVPNPCQVAFVIVSGDGKKRTNVITGTWQR